MVEQMISQQIADPLDVDEATGRSTGVDALAAACANGHVACVQLLLKQDIDMCCRDADGKPLLVIAAMNGNADVVEALITKIQGSKARSTLKWTWSRLNAYQWAARSGHAALLPILAKAGVPERKQREPAPRTNPESNCPFPRPKGRDTARFLDLTLLRDQRGRGDAGAREMGRQQRSRFPDLIMLEYELRVRTSDARNIPALTLLPRGTHETDEAHCVCDAQVYLNGGDESMPLALLPTLAQQKVSTVVELRPGLVFRKPPTQPLDEVGRALKQSEVMMGSHAPHLVHMCAH